MQKLVQFLFQRPSVAVFLLLSLFVLATFSACKSSGSMFRSSGGMCPCKEKQMRGF